MLPINSSLFPDVLYVVIEKSFNLELVNDFICILYKHNLHRNKGSLGAWIISFILV